MTFGAQLRFAVLAALASGASPRTSLADWHPQGTPVCMASDWQGDQQLVADGSGGVIVTWTDTRGDSTADVYAQRLNSTGIPLWPADGVIVCAAAGNQLQPLIVGDGSGGGVIVWWDSRSGIETDIYAQRLNSAGVAQWEADGVPVCTEASRQSFPAVIPDGGGGVIVTWADRRSVASDDIYAQRLNGAGVPQWIANGIALCANASNQSIPTIAPGPAGGAIVAWHDHRNGQPDIYAQRVNAAGTTQWIADGVVLCSASNSQSLPSIIPDGGGGAIVVWSDDRSGNTDIYAQKVNALGVPQWPANGVAVCTAAGSQAPSSPPISDGTGGVILAWYDARNYGLTGHDIYAQRLSSSGSPQWTSNGVAVCTAARAQREPHVATDRSGGAVIVWQDDRYGGSGYYADDVFAQRIGASGTAQWAPDGVAVCTAADGQYAPHLANDGSDVVVTWEDYRGDVSDIYALRLDIDGPLPTTVNTPPLSATLALLPNVPNPFSGSTQLNVYSRHTSDVRLDVFDVAGRRVTTRGVLRLRPGWQHVDFDGRGDLGAVLPSGVYFCRVTAGGQSLVQKVVIRR